jgi:hypothetical protein
VWNVDLKAEVDVGDDKDIDSMTEDVSDDDESVVVVNVDICVEDKVIFFEVPDFAAETGRGITVDIESNFDEAVVDGGALDFSAVDEAISFVGADVVVDIKFLADVDNVDIGSRDGNWSG